MHVTIIVSTAVEKLTRIHKRIFRKLWKFPFSTRLNKSVIYIFFWNEQKWNEKFKQIQEMEEFLHFPVKYVAGGEKISENIGIGGGEREREQGLRGKLWEIGHGRFSFPRGLLEPVSGYRSVEARWRLGPTSGVTVIPLGARLSPTRSKHETDVYSLLSPFHVPRRPPPSPSF